MPAEGLELLELGTGSLEAREDGEYVEWAGLKLPRPGASCPPAALQQALLKMARGPEFDCSRYGTQVSPPSQAPHRAVDWPRAPRNWSLLGSLSWQHSTWWAPR